MIDRLRITIEPKLYTEGWTALKIEVVQDGESVCYENIIPNGDHLHSTLDHMWVVAKYKLEEALEGKRPLVYEEKK